MTDLDAVLVRIDDRGGEHPVYGVWHRICAERQGESIAASVRVCIEWTIGGGEITAKQRDVRCARCDRVLSQNTTPGVAGVYRVSGGSGGHPRL